MKRLFILLLTSLSAATFGQGFLHRDGQNIVDGSGQNVLLRGLGLGGWMVQEGYMLQTDAFAGPQHKIRQKITELIGATNTEAFYQAYRNNGITKRDIDSLKAWGFNSVRLPMHYNLYTLPIEQETGSNNTWLDEGFQRTDQLLQWCAENQMYLILDMHAAPGGQGKDANISDYDPTKPSLWEDQRNKDKMVALWKKLAERYKDSPWMGAYDLINEPNWNFSGANQNGCDEGANGNGPLRALMVSITQAIRQVDNNHLIFIEGNCWGNNYNGIMPLWDNNMALSFHKYWNANNVGAIQGIMNLRTQHNVPIWLGETGENSNVWFRDAISLIESNNIGWAWWPMKKVESIAGITDVKKRPEYQQLLNYWRNGGSQPSQAFATAALMQLAEDYKMENVTVKTDVIDAMFRQIQTNETKKYKNHVLPGKVFATHYDLGTNGHAYWDTDVANYRTDTGTFTDWNKGWAMRNDGVDIQACTDGINNGFQVGFIESNEWLLYTISSATVTAYDVDIRYAGVGGKLYLEDASGKISETITLPNTGGYTTWGTATLSDVILKAGENKVKMFFEAAGFNLNYLDFKNPRASSTVALKVTGAATGILGDRISVTFNKDLQSGINFSQSNLSLKVNGNAVAISAAAFDTTNNKITIKPASAINAGDVVTLTYAGTNLIAADATVQAVFTDKPVDNKVGNIIGISGTIEAENFYFNNGLTLENSSDTGAGSNIAYTDAGDYLDYLVNINPEGNYKIEYRTSGESQTGKVKLELINDDTTLIQTVSFLPTGGWQTWRTTFSQANLPAGRYKARVTVIDPGFNLNWIKFTNVVPDDDNDNVGNDVDLCPNTPAGDVVDFNGCTIFSLASNNFTIKTTGETCRTSNNGSVEITSLITNNFVAKLSGNGTNAENPFTEGTSFSNLPSGTYNLCITLPSVPTFQRCFEVAVTEPQDLSVLSKVSNNDFKVTIDLNGGSVYTIDLNGMIYMTDQHSIVLNLKAGTNALVVKTDKECQGVYSERIQIDDKIMVYPNPIKENTLFVSLPIQKSEQVSVQVFSMLGKLVIDTTILAEGQTIALDTSILAAGTYILKVVSSAATYNSKIIRQ